jgi:DNA-binding transcriptional regulator GbsR (MarR family)
MKLKEAQQQFIASWGAFGTNWGINRTMAQIHALLLIATDPLSQDDMMEQLSISRGNVNMNIRDLIDWGLVHRVLKPGERKEFFSAEKDMWKVAAIIMRERKKRELDPIMRLMDQLQDVEGDKKEVKQFNDTIANIKQLGSNANKLFDLLSNSDQHWFMKLLK